MKYDGGLSSRGERQRPGNRLEGGLADRDVDHGVNAPVEAV
jgi:hypothetical protein